MVLIHKIGGNHNITEFAARVGRGSKSASCDGNLDAPSYGSDCRRDARDIVHHSRHTVGTRALIATCLAVAVITAIGVTTTLAPRRTPASRITAGAVVAGGKHKLLDVTATIVTFLTFTRMTVAIVFHRAMYSAIGRVLGVHRNRQPCN